MELVVLSPEKEFFKGQVKSVTVPGASGQFQILNGHAPLISALSEGNVKIVKDDGNIINYSINSGFIEIIDNELAILVQEARIVD
ncbi:MAG: ATP synthase F1 subunit epsilon [Saprospiraceae bacterium]|jgi:F-type H+-transporting ATPase subunit epsilon|nr:ATP synthase F1 subunit epsilon [Saprospiraceae bacterium]